MTVSELTRLFPGFVNVEKIVQAYIPCYDKRIVSKNDFLALPHAEIDTAKVLQVFEHYFDEYESKKHTIDENLKWSDLHPDEFEITLVDLKESQFKNINIASLVNAFLKLKQEEPSAGYADLKNYKLPLENPEALVDVLIAFKNELLAETGTAPSLKELMAKVVTRQMVDDIRYAHNQLKSLDKPPSLVDLLKHKTSGGNPRKVADTIRANSILDYATAIKIDLKGEIDKALNRAKEPEISDIFPITAFTKDGDRITFKVRLRTLVKINNYLTVNGKVNIEEKVSEALVATVRAVEDYHTLLEQYDKIGKTVADNEIVQNELRHSAYTVQSVTIIDSYSAKAHKQ